MSVKAMHDNATQQAKQLIRAPDDFVSESSLRSASAALWDDLQQVQEQGSIFALDFDGEIRHPRYAFLDDPRRGIIPGFAAILLQLRDKEAWQKAFWFESPNDYLRAITEITIEVSICRRVTSGSLSNLKAFSTDSRVAHGPHGTLISLWFALTALRRNRQETDRS